MKTSYYYFIVGDWKIYTNPNVQTTCQGFFKTVTKGFESISLNIFWAKKIEINRLQLGISHFKVTFWNGMVSSSFKNGLR